LKIPAKITFGVNHKNDQQVYLIRDNDIGFNQANSEKAFEPFQRLHDNDEIKGTGNGLTIVKRIINRHNGNILVESEAGKGATFFFTIPD
jgi:light-regulated signal transduction histidine kinase (bacteriophytochrome)